MAFTQKLHINAKLLGAKKICNDNKTFLVETKPMLFPCWKFDHVLVNVGQAQEKTFEKGGL